MFEKRDNDKCSHISQYLGFPSDFPKTQNSCGIPVELGFTSLQDLPVQQFAEANLIFTLNILYIPPVVYVYLLLRVYFKS